ncbi:MAG TPA: hypothetical protein VK453_12015 [Micromonosporaceae bacterium]|nr:hypothetical protein [Micromonosporaceae bacterium]
MRTPTTYATHPGDSLTALDDEAVRRLRELASAHLDRSPGYFRLTGLTFGSAEQTRQFVLDASAALGRLLP